MQKEVGPGRQEEAPVAVMRIEAEVANGGCGLAIEGMVHVIEPKTRVFKADSLGVL